MNDKLTNEEIARLRDELSRLPRGSVTSKTIKGFKRFYLQWTESGKTKSRYLSEDEVEPMRRKVERRRQLTKILRAYPSPEFESEPARLEGTISVLRGESLARWARTAAAWERRDKFDRLLRFVRGPQEPKVCIVYGLRRTGKTTMLMQTVNHLSPDQFDRAVYLKATSAATMREMDRLLKSLEGEGVRYVFIDEVTLMEDFIDLAAIFSDTYASSGMKIVLSGTDSLGFWFALDEELYDRAYMIHTTVIPFAEFSRVLGIRDIDEYIRFGGLMKVGETVFDDEDARCEDASFRDDESTRRYIDTAIARNIQHSLRCFNHGRRFLALRDLYEAGQLTDVINRIVEDMNHDFLMSVLLKDFKSHDLHSAAQLLYAKDDGSGRFDLLGSIDERRVTARLMDILDIWNENERSVGITKAHLSNVRDWLLALDMLRFTPVKSVDWTDMPSHAVFTQPGMRFVQAQALVFSLVKEDRLAECDPTVLAKVRDKVLEDVKGRMLEDIVVSETIRALPRNADPLRAATAFKLVFPRGEFDMVVHRPEQRTFELFEVKHSDHADDRQARYLRDPEKIAAVEAHYGRVVSRTVLYRGPTFTAADGVIWRNVEDYLTRLA